VCRAVNSLGVVPYDEESGKGMLRYVQLTAAGGEASGGRAQLDALATIQVFPGVAVLHVGERTRFKSTEEPGG